MYRIHLCIANFFQKGFSMVDTQAEPASARRQKTRERLLDAAYDVFAEVGVDAAPVELIAERAGFTRGAFYSNFESKGELFMALAERENAERLEKVREGVRDVIPNLSKRLTGTDDEKLDALTEAVAGFLKLQGDDRHWCLIEAEFRIQALRSPEFGTYLAEYFEVLIGRLADTLVSTIDMLGFHFVVDPIVAARTIVSSYHMAVEKRLMMGEGRPPHEDEELQRMIASLVSVMTARNTA